VPGTCWSFDPREHSTQIVDRVPIQIAQGREGDGVLVLIQITAQDNSTGRVSGHSVRGHEQGHRFFKLLYLCRGVRHARAHDLAERRQGQAHENSDDGDDDQHLDQRVAWPPAAVLKESFHGFASRDWSNDSIRAMPSARWFIVAWYSCPQPS